MKKILLIIFLLNLSILLFPKNFEIKLINNECVIIESENFRIKKEGFFTPSYYYEFYNIKCHGMLIYREIITIIPKENVIYVKEVKEKK